MVKISDLSGRAYNPFSSELKVNVYNDFGCTILEIINSFGQVVFRMCVSPEYLKFNGLKLNKVIKAISPEDLANRFLNSLQNQDKLERKNN